MEIIMISISIAILAIILDAIVLIKYENETKESLKPVSISYLKKFTRR
jgi:hypothetical protein